ncbi:VOC family protein [Sphingomonas pituitosa]|uniref:VOC family protein n=1 Tax=Sphingomonas pituitosa TaxID=99597 RepID=UPI0008301565|nr:VOC family protein [Sphingomonas pituitosa]
MIDHIGINTADIDRARRFYAAALAPLGIGLEMEVTPEQTGGYHGLGFGHDGKPFFWVGSGGAATGPMHIAFTAGSRAEVDAFHAAALAIGGTDNGAPGLRPHYHPHYYGAFVLGPDGINVEAVCHQPA